jgi:hypothetical protein
MTAEIAFTNLYNMSCLVSYFLCPKLVVILVFLNTFFYYVSRYKYISRCIEKSKRPKNVCISDK